MHRRIRTVLSVAVAIAALVAGTASAIEVSPAGTISSSSLGLVTFRNSFADWECRWTLGGTLESSIADVEEAHVGAVTRAAADECRGGYLTMLAGQEAASWSIELLEEAGPNLTGSGPSTRGTVGLAVSNLRFLMEVIGVSCLYTGQVLAVLEVSGEPLTTELFRITGTNIRRTSGSIFCPSTGSLAGVFSLTTQTLRL